MPGKAGDKYDYGARQEYVRGAGEESVPGVIGDRRAIPLTSGAQSSATSSWYWSSTGHRQLDSLSEISMSLSASIDISPGDDILPFSSICYPRLTSHPVPYAFQERFLVGK